MKRKNGFTLVELLAVIILIALISAIAVPSAINLSSKAKERAYKSKIDIMEKNAVSYGQTVLNNVRTGKNPLGSVSTIYTVKFNYDSEGNITKANLSSHSSSNIVLSTNEYMGFVLSLEQLVDVKNLNYDKTDACPSCSAYDKQFYNNVILNPKTNYIINKCNMYFYYKNNRVYTYFDEKTCSDSKNGPNEGSGNEYKPK